MRKITRVEYNWGFSNENGEEYGVAEVGKQGVIEIRYHQPHDEDNLHYCDIYYDNSTKQIIRVFNLSKIIAESEAGEE